MKRIVLIGCLLTVGLAAFGQPPPGQAGSGQGGCVVFPPDPVQVARRGKILSLRNQAETAYKAGDTNRTIDLLRQAVDLSKEGGIAPLAYDLARVFTLAGRQEDALEAYKQVFKWDEKKGDLISACGGDVGPVMNYAILLAQMGKAEEAKAIYYLGLSMFNLDGDRGSEPVPFLTVFDPDPDGIYMEYSPRRLEGAARMAKVLRSGYGDITSAKGPFLSPQKELAQIKQLAPDWFYPRMLEASHAYNDAKKSATLLAAAKALANDQERQLIDRYEVELAEHIQLMKAAGTEGAGDERPMTEGNRRRALMKVLKPNPTILKRLAAE